MKIKFILFVIACIAFSSQSLFAQIVGCFPHQELLPGVKDEHACTTYKVSNGVSCWVASQEKCYAVPYVAECNCIQNGGTVCTGALEAGGEFGYCKWNDKGIDIWRYYWGLLTKPSHIKHSPPDVEDFCGLLGGKVKGENCVDFYNNQRQRTTCNLTSLWDLTCPDVLVHLTSKDSQGH